MLTQELDRETMRYLSDILAQENTTRDELIRNLIRDRWLLLNRQAAPRSGEGASAASQTGAFTADLSPNLQTASLDTPQSEVGLSELEALGSEAVRRPRNPKQALAEFVKRRNQRAEVFS